MHIPTTTSSKSTDRMLQKAGRKPFFRDCLPPCLPRFRFPVFCPLSSNSAPSIRPAPAFPSLSVSADFIPCVPAPPCRIPLNACRDSVVPCSGSRLPASVLPCQASAVPCQGLAFPLPSFPARLPSIPAGIPPFPARVSPSCFRPSLPGFRLPASVYTCRDSGSLPRMSHTQRFRPCSSGFWDLLRRIFR